MQTIQTGQIWKNTNSGNEIKILKNLGKGKWWVEGKAVVGKFKIRENMIHDNYKLKEVD